MKYYAISDIHGFLDQLKDVMNLVNLKDDNKLVFLGDYIDYGEKSCEVLYYIKKLSETYKNQVIVLMGNHEEMFLEWLHNPKEYVRYYLEEKDLHTLKTFLSDDEIKEFSSKMNSNNDIIKKSIELAKLINNKHKDLIMWLCNLPYYYETNRQIFVHAGIEEEAGKLWKVGTPKIYFTGKYPNFPFKPKHFYKDIISGHIGTAQFRKDKNNHKVFWDGKSHYYIDGMAKESSFIPVLKYDTNTGVYTSFIKEKNNNFEEYEIKKESENKEE